MPEMTFKVSLEEFGKKAAEYALDEITYNDLTIREWIEKIASGEFAEQRHGLWIATGFMGEEGRREYKCSECKSTVLVFDENLPKFVVHEPYCAGCGAKMDGGAENA